MDSTSLYEADFYAWTQEQVNLLKTQQWHQRDAVHLIAEIDALHTATGDQCRLFTGNSFDSLKSWHILLNDDRKMSEVTSTSISPVLTAIPVAGWLPKSLPISATSQLSIISL